MCGRAWQIIDTFPSQRPVPSLGGGIGYGAEGVDCWEMQEAVGNDCLIPVEDTGAYMYLPRFPVIYAINEPSRNAQMPSLSVLQG